MLQTATSSINDKGYLLVPYRVRRALRLKPRQMVTMRVIADRKVELEPMLTLDEVFKLIKPAKKNITRKQMDEEKKMIGELIAKNVMSETL